MNYIYKNHLAGEENYSILNKREKLTNIVRSLGIINQNFSMNYIYKIHLAGEENSFNLDLFFSEKK
jgi:hypothetical protein